MNEIVQVNFPLNQYYQEEYNKTQIVLHHTASGDGSDGDLHTWEGDAVRVATCVIIERNGTIKQAFPSKCWAYHLGLQQSIFTKYGVPYKSIDKTSIGIEIDSWGFLKKVGNDYFAWTGQKVPTERVEVLDVAFRGQKYFEAYTDAQIEGVKKLLLLWNSKYKIPLHYNENMWDVSKDALNGKTGVYGHTSFRMDKIDIYPSVKMISMLKSLTA